MQLIMMQTYQRKIKEALIDSISKNDPNIAARNEIFNRVCIVHDREGRYGILRPEDANIEIR